MIYNSNFQHIYRKLRTELSRFVSVLRHPLASTWWHLLSLGFRYSASWWQMEIGGFIEHMVCWNRCFFLKMVMVPCSWFLLLKSMSRWDFLKWNMERWWVCLLKVGGNFWSGLPTNQNRDSIPVGWSFWGVASPPTSAGTIWASGNARDACVSLGFLGVTKTFHVFLILFLQAAPKLKWSNSSEFRSTQIYWSTYDHSQFLQLTGWSWQFRGGLFVSINFRPCSFGSLQLRHWRCWFMSPTQNMLPASSTRQSQEILR